MDFIRLAMREVRRNSSRTAIAIAAMALATVVIVLSRIVPQGYMRNQAIAERVFAGADILVWTAPAHVRADDQSELEWRAWKGAGWQSYAEYFIPSLPTEGYVSPSAAPLWQPMDALALSKSLTEVTGVARVEPYLALPCQVEVGDVVETVILRGREPDRGPHPLAMEGQVKSGRALRPGDDGALNALVPLVSDPCLAYIPQGELEIKLPRLMEKSGATELDWANSVTKVLTQVGAYTVQIGETPELEGSGGAGGRQTPEYWKRPEIIVNASTFKALVEGALAAPVGTHVSPPASSPAPPVYQLLVTVLRPSETRAVVERIREQLGPDYAVFSIPELAAIRDLGGGQQILSRDMSPVITAALLTMAAAIVAGSVYVLLALETRKIGLMRAIGATSKDILVYVLAVISYTTLIGAGIGFLLGKLITLTVLMATDFTFLEWLRMTAFDAFLALSGLAISLALGLAVALWASRIPCAEVLRRE